jgi:hypothetical protein
MRSLLVIIVFMTFAVIGAALAQERVTLKDATICCAWKMQEKVRDYAIAKDEEAVKRLWLAGMLTGD